MAFSGALTLTDLNDFLTPSQACIKPVEQVNGKDQANHEPGAAATEIRIDAGGEYYEVSGSKSLTTPSTTRKLERAEINLNDCLACSGCITSAESVLITLQSHAEVLSFLDSNPDPSSPSHKVPVLSIAPQSLASLATSISSSSRTPVTLAQVLRRVRAFCTGVLGFAHVWDTTFARHIALLEHAREYSERKQEGPLPMLASACPGWICYAEKTHKEMLPFIAKTKSPQQLMGTLVKEWMAKRWGRTPDQIYHVSVMPCYDKKLEASRQDFYNEAYSVRDVDCVITTGELELMMREKAWDLSMPAGVEEAPLLEAPVMPELIAHPGTSSGSYLHSVISSITSASAEPLTLSVRAIRADYEEYTLQTAPDQGEGRIVFKGAKCYGFRNLQNVVRKVGRDAGVQVGRGAAGKLAGGLRGRARKGGGAPGEGQGGYDYVEVMACPGGCLNGGGQLKPPTSDQESETGRSRIDAEQQGTLQNARWGDREWLKKVETAYWHDLPTPPESPTLAAVDRDPDALAVQILTELCQPENTEARWAAGLDTGAEKKRRALFRTQYRAVESETIGLAVKW